MNKAIIIGRLGRDPESNGTVTKLSLATTEKWTDKSGQRQEHTEWHRVALFGRTAETAARYLAKGQQVAIEGRIRTSKYVDKQGVEKYSTEIVCDRMHLLSSRQGGVPGESADTSRGPSQHEDEGDDIPF
jgi:single-strand DNA-binding protein